MLFNTAQYLLLLLIVVHHFTTFISKNSVSSIDVSRPQQ